MKRLPWLCLAGLAGLPVAAWSQPALLALYTDRTDGSSRLHDLIANTPLGVGLTDCCRTVSGTLTFDPATREILLVHQGDAAQEVVRISAVTGAVVGRVAVGGGWQLLAAAYDRTRSRLFAIGRNDAGDRHLVWLAPTSGTVTAVGAALPAGFAFVPGGHGLHPRRGQWHLLGYADGAPNSQRVLTLALDTGTILTDVATGTHVLSNLFFDEGSGRLLGLGRPVDGPQTQTLWFDPGTGQSTVLTSSNADGCCAWSVGSLSAIAAEAVTGSHYLMANGTTYNFLIWNADDGGTLGSLPHLASWAIHGLVVDQTGFIGDHVFYDGFERAAKPTGGDLPFE